MQEMITITKEEYYKLVDAYHYLGCLEAAGVDEWQGFDIAVSMYNSECDEQ